MAALPLPPADRFVEPCPRHSLNAFAYPGQKNVWADELSRDNLKRFAHRRQERLRFSPDSLARSGKCLTLHPPAARWRDEHIAAART